VFIYMCWINVTIAEPKEIIERNNR